MPAQANNEIETLLAPMVKKTLYVAISRAISTSEDMLPFVAEHLRYMNELERRGVLFGSGPFVQPGVIVGDGLTILRADSIEGARLLMEEEPLIKRGMRTFDLRQWELREGSISVNLHLSRSAFELL
jgi:uncharacterized protein YciI